MPFDMSCFAETYCYLFFYAASSDFYLLFLCSNTEISYNLFNVRESGLLCT